MKCDLHGLNLGYQTALSGEACLRIVVIRNYVMARYRWYHAEQKLHLYYARRSCFAPSRFPTQTVPVGNWWRRRVPPPGPQRLFHAPFIAIVGKPTLPTIGSCGQKKRGRAALPLYTTSWMERARGLIVPGPGRFYHMEVLTYRGIWGETWSKSSWTGARRLWAIVIRASWPLMSGMRFFTVTYSIMVDPSVAMTKSNVEALPRSPTDQPRRRWHRHAMAPAANPRAGRVEGHDRPAVDVACRGGKGV